MIQRQSDSFFRFAHSSTLLSTFFFSLSLCLRFSLRSPPSPDVAAVSAASSARQRAEGGRRGERVEEEDDEKSHNPLERRSLDSRVCASTEKDPGRTRATC